VTTALHNRNQFCQNLAVQDDGHFVPAGSIRSLGYRVLWSCAQAFHRAGHACMYAAAGLLRKDDFRAASRLLWAEYGTLVEDVDGGLEAWERRLYDTVLRPPDRILLVGCGAGRDLLALRELGHEVTGLDPTPELVDQARRHLARRGVTATIREGFVETVDLGDQYDLVVLAGNCYSFLLSAASRIATLTRIKAHLAPQGRVVITYTGAVRRPPISIHVTRIISRMARADWRPEEGDSFSRDYLKHRLLRYEHMFGPGEVERECAEAGLRVVRDVRTAAYYVVAVPAL
jgi:SAM-dependent methyltransferase